MPIVRILLIFIAAILDFVATDVIIYSSGDYKMTLVNNDPTFREATRHKCIDTFFATMPKMCSRFNRNQCVRDIRVTIDPNYDGVAYTSGNAIVISAKWLRDHPNDTDVLTHECMHVVQNYPRGDPGWLVEGIADYGRWKYGRNNLAAGWTLPNFDHGQHYTNSYGVTARFLVWCEARYPNIVDQLDSALRNNIYSNNSWNLYAGGKSVDQLWNEYSNNPMLY